MISLGIHSTSLLSQIDSLSSQRRWQAYIVLAVLYVELAGGTGMCGLELDVEC